MATLTMQGVEVTVDDSFKELSPEAQRAAADEILNSPQFQERLAAQGEEVPPLGFLNQALAGSLGGPVDLINAGLGLMGLESDQPVGGSRSIEALMQAGGIGLPEEGQRPQTLGERVQRGIGETAGAVLPFGAAASAVSKGAGLAGQAARTMLQAPGTGAALDLASGVTSGVGAQVAAENFPGSDTAEALGSLVGGLTPAAAVPAAKGLAKAAVLPRLAKKIAVPFTKAGATRRAATRAQSLVSDPEAAARAATGETISDLSPAQRTGEPRLLALEREVLNKNVPLESEFAERTAASTSQLRGELEAISGPAAAGDTQAFIEGRRARLTNALEVRAQQAAAEAQRRIAQVTPERRAMESSVIVREELDKALSSARAQERANWEDVPQNVTASTNTAKSKYQKFLSDTPRAQQDDIPDVAGRFLGEGKEAFGGKEPVKELHGLYSRLREEARLARASNQFNSARISDDLADSVLVDLNSAEGVSGALDVARGFSLELNQKFTQGAVGRVLGHGRTGGPGVDPQLTLQSTVGRGGDAGAVQAEQILRAAPSARSEVGQFLVDEFEKAAVRNGQFNPRAAREFARKTTALDQTPGLERDMLAAADAAEGATRASERAARIAKDMASPNKSRASAFMNAAPSEEIARVVGSSNPRRAAKELVRQVRKDPTGQALKGLKSATIEDLIQRADKTGELSGKALKAALRNKSVSGVASEILSKPELARVRRIADELTKLEAAGGKLPKIGGIISDVPSTILDLVIRMSGARTGSAVARAIGGGAIQIPADFAARSRQFLGRLTNDKAKDLLIEAVQDRSGGTMSMLLTRSATPGQSKIAARRLNAWLAGPGQRFAESLEEDEQ